jgi:hypothetical protein
MKNKAAKVEAIVPGWILKKYLFYLNIDTILISLTHTLLQGR